MLLYMLVSAVVAAAGAGEAADATAASVTAPPAAAAKSADKMGLAGGDVLVCKSEQTTGSRFPQRVCRRKAEADQKRQDDHDRLRQEQRSTGGVVR